MYARTHGSKPFFAAPVLLLRNAYYEFSYRRYKNDDYSTDDEQPAKASFVSMMYMLATTSALPLRTILARVWVGDVSGACWTGW